jgi:site-specific recombinase XerD
MDDNGKVRSLERSDVQAILEVPSFRSFTVLRNRCITGIMYDAGIRISEALVLKPRDASTTHIRTHVVNEDVRMAMSRRLVSQLK